MVGCRVRARTFAEEMGKASWDIVWIQLLIYAVLGALLSFLASLISPNRYNFAGSSSTATLPPATLQAITLGTSFGLIILVPLGFFIGVGIIYLIAKAFKGSGTFLQQSYTNLLVGVPIGLLSLLLALIPILGSLASFALGIYSIVRITSLLPHPPPVIQCAQCRRAYWLADAEVIGRLIPSAAGRRRADPAWAGVRTGTG